MFLKSILQKFRVVTSSTIFAWRFNMTGERKIWHWIVLGYFIFAGVFAINRPDLLQKIRLKLK